MKTKLSPAEAWAKIYEIGFRLGWSFTHARGWFFGQYHYWPPLDLPLTPSNEIDWYRLIKYVPRESLRS